MERVVGRRYAAVCAALAAQRLAEVGWSKRNLRRSGPGRQAAPRSLPLMVAANVALFTVPPVTRHGRAAPPRSVQAAAAAGLLGAVSLRLWVIRTLGEGWNVAARVPDGLTVVTGGPYRHVRHPNYVAVALEFACLPLLAGAYVEGAALSLANALVLAPRIRAEERLLDAVPGYREAFADIPRFIPRRPGRRVTVATSDAREREPVAR